MKSESEFIAGVWEKYELERQKRVARYRRISALSAVSVCACILIVVSIKSFPSMNMINDGALSYDASENEHYSDLDGEVVEYGLTGSAFKSVRAAVDEEVAAESDARDNGELGTYSTEYCLTASFASDDADMSNDETRVCRTESGSVIFEYVLPDDIDDTAVTVYSDGALSIDNDEAMTSDSGALYCALEDLSGYKIAFEANDEVIGILVKGTPESIDIDSVKMIADSLKCVVKSDTMK